MEPKITTFKQIKEIIEPIPADKFQTRFYGRNIYRENWNGQHCFLGHIHRHFGYDEEAFGDFNGYGARQLTETFLLKKYGLFNTSGSNVNNSQYLSGYGQPEIKDRLMAMIEDGIKWESNQ